MTNWKIDPTHASVTFKTQHMGISWVRGIINGAEGMVSFEPGDLENISFEASMDVSTINSGLAMRDGHLKSPDFLDVVNHPKAAIKSIEVESATDNSAKIKALLTIKGISKEIML